MQHRLLLALTLAAGCTATVQSQPQTTPPPPPPPAMAPPPPAPAPAAVEVVAAPPSPAAPMPPPPPQKHPAYLHALTDLRSARAYLERPAGVAVKWDEQKAIREIDAAIGEIKKASIDDGKPLSDHPAVDSPTWGGRLQRANELVVQASRDASQEEDNGEIRGLRARAEKHISNASHYIKEGMEDAKALHEQPAPPPPAPPVVMAPPPADHPAYLHALSDLRHARALLEKPAKTEVKWDENNGIHEIDAAINEIKQAAIDDGKPLAEHPPIDVKWKHRDRLKEAERLLHKSAQDIEEHEDNNWAKGLRGRANGHIRNAEHAIHEAMEDRHH